MTIRNSFGFVAENSLSISGKRLNSKIKYVFRSIVVISLSINCLVTRSC